ncbi:hypothetical protein [Aurantimonas sp. VKM B-3413]|uniref:hypothetical protein n=1 Tax=Aurantimonas sp. VKM B-3413 TaxID=2779401 RepID=UPI001E5A545D|nr:hypothetical protein [Aurantimonas sp. VKM B-3413]MCB8835824.1 hypothetical protein [Aurantimonas sp. VKM B-3413]
MEKIRTNPPRVKRIADVVVLVVVVDHQLNEAAKKMTASATITTTHTTNPIQTASSSSCGGGRSNNIWKTYSPDAKRPLPLRVLGGRKSVMHPFAAADGQRFSCCRFPRASRRRAASRAIETLLHEGEMALLEEPKGHLGSSLDSVPCAG